MVAKRESQPGDGDTIDRTETRHSKNYSSQNVFQKKIEKGKEPGDEKARRKRRMSNEIWLSSAVILASLLESYKIRGNILKYM